MTHQILVVAKDDDTSVMINREIGLVNYLIDAFPGTVFICRGTHLLTELFQPRPPSWWGDYYMRVLECCDALYVHDGDRSHPLADYATDLDIPILDDELDVELFITSEHWQKS